MRIHVLGSGAGGGFPQWNCSCANCATLRRGELGPAARTQSSLCVSADGERWLLINASPDLRAQIESFPALQPGRAPRDTALCGVLIVDAQIDHTTGLMTLREHTQKLRVYATRCVHADLTDGYPLLSVLEHYCGVDWHEIAIDPCRAIEVPELPGVGILPVPVPCDAPPYSPRRHRPEPGDNIGLRFTSETSGASLFYAPGLATIDAPILREIEAADCLLLDGTLFTDAELIEQGVAAKTGGDMGHLQQSGAGGLLAVLARYPEKRRILIHVNNTNPILDPRSEAHARVAELGVEIAYDGLEIEL